MLRKSYKTHFDPIFPPEIVKYMVYADTGLIQGEHVGNKVYMDSGWVEGGKRGSRVYTDTGWIWSRKGLVPLCTRLETSNAALCYSREGHSQFHFI